MPVLTETKLDFDRTVNTEDRFAIRKFISTFIQAINKGEHDVYSSMLSDALIVEGFSDIAQVKVGFVNMLKHRLEDSSVRTTLLPQLKLSYSHFLFHLKGTYEEIVDGILTTEGNIELSLIKEDNTYKIVRIHFYPRMMLNDDV